MSDANPKTSLAQVFQKCIPESMRQWLVDEGDVILRIPAKSSDVGDLLVYDDEDELTVAVGSISHSHFGEWPDSSPTVRGRQEYTCRSAIDWIANVLNNRVRFRPQYIRGRLISGGSWNVDYSQNQPLLDLTDEWREFTWAGQELHEHRTLD